MHRVDGDCFNSAWATSEKPYQMPWKCSQSLFKLLTDVIIPERGSVSLKCITNNI